MASLVPGRAGMTYSGAINDLTIQRRVALLESRKYASNSRQAYGSILRGFCVSDISGNDDLCEEFCLMNV